MDVDPMESATAAEEDNEDKRVTAAAHRLNTMVAITVALLATFLGLCKVKDDNIVQAMQQAQSDRIDQWSFYQARNIREEIGKATLTELELARAAAPDARTAAYDEAIGRYRALVSDEASKKARVEQQAKQDEETYDALNYRDDQFDLSDTLAAVSISLMAVTALTHKRWLYWLALFPTALAFLMGLAGLFGWPIHPDIVVRLLS